MSDDFEPIAKPPRKKQKRSKKKHTKKAGIVVSGLPKTMTVDELVGIFRKCGIVKKVSPGLVRTD